MPKKIEYGPLTEYKPGMDLPERFRPIWKHGTHSGWVNAKVQSDADLTCLVAFWPVLEQQVVTLYGNGYSFHFGQSAQDTHAITGAVKRIEGVVE